jgi:predicted TIM-barrel fold metal-dependent hydrolase
MNQKPARRVIAIEEAFVHPAVWRYYSDDLKRRLAPIFDRLSDVGPKRIHIMDAAGIDMQVLSHAQPGVQILKDEDAPLAIAVSREVNDWLGEIVKIYPSRFAGFAMLPTQSPLEAADELERTVKKLNFKGALINGHTNGRYLDDASFRPLLERAERLEVPIYIHPTDPPKSISTIYYEPFDETLVPAWGWPVETGTHLLRMMCGGVFDRHPRLRIIVGHMGELLPYCYARLNLITMGDWLLAAQDAKLVGEAPRARMQRSFAYYMRNNVYITSSGVFEQPVFDCAVAMLGLDHLIFSVDSPMRDNVEAIEFLANCKLSPADKERFAHETAEKLLKLPPFEHQLPSRSFKFTIDVWKARIRSKLGRLLIRALIG